MTTCTFAFENPSLMEKLKEYAESLGGKLISQSQENDYTPKTKQEILDDFTNVVRDIKSGKAFETAMDFDEFARRLERC